MNLGVETEFVEFKESTGEKPEALESIAAIINKHGKGTLYFGIRDNGEVKGQIITDSTIKDISDSIFRDIEPRIIPTIKYLSTARMLHILPLANLLLGSEHKTEK